MVDTSVFTGNLMLWMRSGLIWAVAGAIFIFIVFVTLSLRKKQKLKYPVLELTNLGNGKIGVLQTKAGWFKTKTALFGLLDYGGEEQMLLKDGRKVMCASSSDFHDIFGKRGLIVKRKDDDLRIVAPVSEIELKRINKKSEVYPISKMDVPNYELLASVAPADYRDASIQIIKASENETMSKLDQYLPYIMLGGIIILFVISFIVGGQIFNRAIDKATALSERTCAETCADMASGAVSGQAP